MKRNYDEILVSIEYLCDDVMAASTPTDPFVADIFDESDFATGGGK